MVAQQRFEEFAFLLLRNIKFGAAKVRKLNGSEGAQRGCARFRKVRSMRM
jgi:hypothetical protein